MGYLIWSYWYQLVTPGHGWSQWYLSRYGTFTIIALMDFKAPWSLIRNVQKKKNNDDDNNNNNKKARIVSLVDLSASPQVKRTNDRDRQWNANARDGIGK